MSEPDPDFSMITSRKWIFKKGAISATVEFPQFPISTIIWRNAPHDKQQKRWAKLNRVFQPWLQSVAQEVADLSDEKIEIVPFLSPRYGEVIRAVPQKGSGQ